MKYYPLFYKLNDKPCLIVGGGSIALRRAKGLLSAGAIVDIQALSICESLKALLSNSAGTLSEEAFNPSVLRQDYTLIIAATDQPAVNQQVADYAKHYNIALNRVDDQQQCDFIFPSIIDREPLTIAVSNSGSSPVLSKILKKF